MGDMSEGFQELTRLRKERHEHWKVCNTSVMQRSGIPFRTVNSGETLVIRVDGKPRVDFFPSTGRWKNIETGVVSGGGANAFLAWFKEQELKENT